MTDRPRQADLTSPATLEVAAQFLLEQVAPDGATLPWARRKAEALVEALLALPAPSQQEDHS